MSKPAKTIAEIASKHLGIDTLEERKSDHEDFYEVHVRCVADALQAAYEAGRASR